MVFAKKYGKLKSKTKKDYSSILEDCAKVAKERQKQYGSAGDSIQLTCDILDLNFGIKLTVSDFAKVLVALKLAREKFQHKDDNIIDAINYLAISLNERTDDKK